MTGTTAGLRHCALWGVWVYGSGLGEGGDGGQTVYADANRGREGVGEGHRGGYV